MRDLIINADDFGLAPEVNEAVERAHREGILTSASLMVGGPAAADAVERARTLPSLAVGLHVVVSNSRPLLPADEVPDLAGRDGEFCDDLVASGFRYFFLPRVRRQLEREIRAQFAAFARTGLRLDHANAHNHMHLHPTVLGLILSVGREYGLPAVRVPDEPGGFPPLVTPWLHILRHRVRRAGVRTNSRVAGLRDTGAMTEERVLALVENLGAGLTEFYFHPAVSRNEELARRMPDYQHAAEFEALVSTKVARAISESGVRLTTYSSRPIAAPG